MDPEPKEISFNEPWGQAILRTIKAIGKIVGWIFGIGILIVLSMQGYEWLDENGYNSHDKTLDVYMSNNWIVGENKNCSVLLEYDSNKLQTGRFLSLLCGTDYDTQPHNIKVSFHGIVDPTDVNGDRRTIPNQWICTRKDDGFSCRPL